MDSRLLDLERLLQNQINNKKIFNIVLAVASGDGRFVWSKAAGLANPEKNGDMRVDTPYYIASVTKIFTASAIMLLHEQGKINLDDPITSFLTKEQLDGIHICKGKDYSQDLKIYHLLSHTSGLADYFEQKNSKGESFFDRILQNGDIEWDVEKVLEIVRNDLEPNFPPALKPGSGHKAAYSDTNYQLLGAILENILGISLGQVFDKFFFKPLELLNTYLYGDDFSSSTRALPATIYNGKQLLNLPKALGSFWADGGIVSTAEEQNQFLDALFDGKIS